MKTFYVMRHGQTLFNQMGRIQGWSDSPLTNQGRLEATMARKFFEQEAIRFDNCYSASSERCCDTLELVTGSASYVRLKGLRDWNFGRMEGQHKDLFPNRESLYDSFGDFYLQYDGESELQFQDRVARTLQSILDDLEEGQTSLILANTGVLIQLLKWLNLDQHLQFAFSDSTIFEFLIEEGNYRLAKLINPMKQVVINLG